MINELCLLKFHCNSTLCMLIEFALKELHQLQIHNNKAILWCCVIVCKEEKITNSLHISFSFSYLSLPCTTPVLCAQLFINLKSDKYTLCKASSLGTVRLLIAYKWYKWRRKTPIEIRHRKAEKILQKQKQLWSTYF